jgi:hypothetical protein
MPKSTADIQMGHATMSLFTGINGSGKTVALGSYPGPIYIFDFDGRMAPLLKMYPNRKDIFYDTYLSFETANRKMKEWMRNGPELSPLGTHYKTIAADSLTTVSKTIIRDNKKLLRPAGNKNQKGTIQIAEIEDYNYEVSGLEDLLSFLKTMREDYKIHAILTAHLIAWDAAVPGTVGKTEVKTQILTAGKKIAPFVPCIFDECYYFETESSTEGVKRYAYTEDFGGNTAKSALQLPYKIDLTNKSFYDEIVRALSEHGISLDTATAEINKAEN